jgi:hypothetical protein
LASPSERVTVWALENVPAAGEKLIWGVWSVKLKTALPMGLWIKPGALAMALRVVSVLIAMGAV